MDKLGEAVAELLHELSVLPLGGEEVAEHSSFYLTNYMLFLIVAFIITLVFFLVLAKKASLVPKGRFANAGEALVEFVRSNIVLDVLGPEGLKYFPFIGTIFFFVLFNNLLGLIPGAKPGTGTMGTTVTWALVVFIAYNAIGIKKAGLWGYLKHFWPKGVAAPLAAFIALLELVSHLIRPLTLSVRLFANMYAGHVMLGIFAIFSSLLMEASGATKAIIILPFALQVVMYAFEVFVAFIQAYIFTVLTSVYIQGAMQTADH